MDIYGALLKAGWGDPTDRVAEAATAAELEPSRPTEPDLKKVAIAIQRLQRLGEL